MSSINSLKIVCGENFCLNTYNPQHVLVNYYIPTLSRNTLCQNNMAKNKLKKFRANKIYRKVTKHGARKLKVELRRWVFKQI